MKKEKIQGFKYHKFLNYFGLFALAVVNSVYAALYFSGVMYGWINENFSAEIAYEIYGNSLKILDIVYGCLLAFGTVLALIARRRLAKFFTDGVHLTCGLLIFQGVIPFVYSVWGHFIMNEVSIINLKNICTFIIYTLIAFLTFKYYKKREEKFDILNKK